MYFRKKRKQKIKKLKTLKYKITQKREKSGFFPIGGVNMKSTGITAFIIAVS